MFVFLELGMSPISYIMWKAVDKGILEDEFSEEVRIALKKRVEMIKRGEVDNEKRS